MPHKIEIRHFVAIFTTPVATVLNGAGPGWSKGFSWGFVDGISTMIGRRTRFGLRTPDVPLEAA
ncbi:hypothetical protein BDV26DRAFT_56407 [Aspergillus bertholletiae]|uniref:Uncharacterized protein n=1 Tax=Aspergillus bertholletiae TaxID=1226010 RepID=A0A5N7BJB0_9EURO|nr:hypothetical protein BDV26DRAFT_56407 [Aspergillus bertholletiae]